MRKQGSSNMTQSEESMTMMTPYRQYRFLHKDHGTRRQKKLLAHVVRLRILACCNDLNRKRIFSLQLTAHS